MAVQQEESLVPNLVAQDARPRVTGPTEDDILEESLAKTALARFYHHSINTSAWKVFDDSSPLRVVYIGTPTSNLSKLVDEEAEFSGSQPSSLHLPFPSVRPTRPWKPPKTLSWVKWYSTSCADDISALPAKDVRDDLVESFFTKIHPGFPVVDESEFRMQYNDTRNPPPLLLFQAVLLVGAHVSDHPKVIRSRSLVKMALFRRAKVLFDLHYENDRMHVIQAALLFTWHFEGADDVSSNAYYWAGIACRVAFGLGMHRNLASTAVNRMPLGDRRIYRRIWWTVYQINVLSSLHHGRPLMIDPDECDQPILHDDDFIEYDGLKNRNINVEYCIHNIALCNIIVSIMKLSSPGALRRFAAEPGSFHAAQIALDSRLASWYLCLPASLTSLNSQSTNFWSLQLQLHYNMALLHLHRLSQPSSTPAEHLQQQTSTDICHTSASSIANLFGDILSTKTIGQCWFTSLTLLLATAIQISHEARSVANDGATVLSIQAQNRLERFLPVMYAVSQYWPSAEAILSLYTDILKQLKRQTQSSFRVQTMAVSPYTAQSPLNGENNTTATRFGDQSLSEDNNSLGNVGMLQALFGAGQVDSLLDLDFDGMNDDWLAQSMSHFPTKNC